MKDYVDFDADKAESKRVAKFRQEVRRRLAFTADRVTVGNDGIVTVKWAFFYRMGRTAGGHADRVRKLFPRADVLDVTENWRAWPKTSYFVVRFRPNIDGEYENE